MLHSYTSSFKISNSISKDLPVYMLFETPYASAEPPTKSLIPVVKPLAFS